MQKNKLDRFIQKYHLGGEVNSVKWSSDGKSLSTTFVTANKSLLGNLKMDKFPIEKIDLGIYKTKELKSMMSVLSDDVDIDIKKSDDRAYYLTMKNASTSLDYVLSDLTVIPDPPALKQLPEFHSTIQLDSDFIDTFIKAKSALSDVDTFTLITDGSDMRTVIGYASTTHTNRVSINVKHTGSLTDKITFNANLFKEVLIANKECSSATLEVSNDGLARMTFKVDEYEAVYYLVADSGNN